MEIDGISFQFSVGGEDKLNSSSIILKNWKYLKEKDAGELSMNYFRIKI